MSNGVISLTFDDGYRSTFEHAAPILARYSMPATVGAICNRVFWEDKPGAMMGVDKLRQLVDASWEVASHSLFHRRLPLLPPSYADEAAHWRYEREADAFVAACPWEDVGTVVYQGKYLQRAHSLQQLQRMRAGFTHDPQRGTIYARTGESSTTDPPLLLGSAEREIAESREVFEKNGFEITSFIVPFSMWPERLHPYGARYYPVVATVRARLNKLEVTLPSQLSRIQINKDRSANDIIKILEDHLSSNSWGIICFHRIVDQVEGMWDWPISKFYTLVEWVAASKASVVTLSSGATRLSSGLRSEAARPQAGPQLTGAA